jgi:hypothetical protein
LDLRKSKVYESPNVNGRFTSHRLSEINPFTIASTEDDQRIISPKNKRRADSEKGWNRASSSGFKAAGPASGESPPTFLKGISSQTKYSSGSNYKNLPEGQNIFLQEVKE